MLDKLKDPKFQQFLREQKGHIYNAAWGAGLLFTLMQSIAYASFSGRLLLLPMVWSGFKQSIIIFFFKYTVCIRKNEFGWI